MVTQSEVMDEKFSKFVFDRFYSNGPNLEQIDNLLLFGQFVGSWQVETMFYDKQEKEIYHQFNEWTFFWILDGRGIQDVLIGPNLSENFSLKPGKRRIGTTVRLFNSSTNLWEITWFGYTSNVHISLVGGKELDQIVLKGIDMDKSSIKWIFSDIKANSFEWTGYTSKDHGETWRIEQKMYATRKNTS